MEILLAMAIFAVSMVGLSLGVIINGRQIKGHCGGNPELPDSCVKDAQGNKVISCFDCDCES